MSADNLRVRIQPGGTRKKKIISETCLWKNLNYCCFIRAWTSHSALLGRRTTRQQFSMENLKKIILLSADFWKQFSVKVWIRKIGLEVLSGLMWQAIASLCVWWHLQGSRSCCSGTVLALKRWVMLIFYCGRVPWTLGSVSNERDCSPSLWRHWNEQRVQMAEI